MLAFLVSWGPVALWAGVLFFLSSLSHPPSGPDLPGADKVAHLGLYLVLGAALAWAGRGAEGRPATLALLMAGLLFAASDEWHQAHVPFRDPSLGDVAADALGILLGFSLARRKIRRWTR